MIDVMSGLSEVKAKTSDALRAAEADSGASVVLVAVVREFDTKADKATRNGDRNGSAREAVLDAHLAICILKTKV